jgi:multicomponent K+:H+ antiporter subunit E
MKRWMPFPLLWVALLAMWLVLAGNVAPADVLAGALAALAGVHGLAALQPPQAKLRRPLRALELAWLVQVDIVRANIAVARIVLHRGTRGTYSGFVDIPLALSNPVGLAALACIVTATPGTAWAGYDPRSGVLTLHVLDITDEQGVVDAIKDRYERRLMEVFQ